MNIFKLTTKNLLGKKGRLLFTLLGIAVAVASFVALMSLGGNMRSQVTAQANAMGANLVIMPDGICVFNQIAVITGERISETIAFEEYERISQISGLAVIPHLTQTAAIRDVEAVVTGILPEQTLAFRDWRMLGGEYFASQDEQGVVVIGADFAQRREIAIGDTLTIRRQDFVVKGILANSASNDDFALFMPLAVAQELFGREGVISFMTAVVDDMAKIDYYTAQIIETGAAQVSTDDELLAHVLSIVASVNITLQVVAAVALVAAVFGIVNTMMTAVYERRREIGILRAIGSKRRTIFVLFMLESAMYGLFGGLLGVALGMLASVFAGDFISQIGANDLMKGAAPAAELSLSLTLTAVGFSLALAMISGVLPALRASKLTPVEAISHE